MQPIPWLDVGWQLQMREIDNSVRWEMIFVLIVWPGHSRPVIKIHYLAPCSVVQAERAWFQNNESYWCSGVTWLHPRFLLAVTYPMAQLSRELYL